MNVNIDSDESVSGTGRKYCRACGYVDTTRGNHPETGPADICPECGPFGSDLFDSKEAMIEYDHESALLRTGKPLQYLDTDTDRDTDLMTDGGQPTDGTEQLHLLCDLFSSQHQPIEQINHECNYCKLNRFSGNRYKCSCQYEYTVHQYYQKESSQYNSLSRTQRILARGGRHSKQTVVIHDEYVGVLCRTLHRDTDHNADLRIDGSHSIDGTDQLSSIASLKSSSSTWEKDAPPHRQPPRVPRGWIFPSSVLVPAKAAPHWSQVTSRSAFSSSSDIACYHQTTPGYLDFTDLRTDGGQTELPSTTHIGESGLWIPPQLREFTGQVVFRTPRGTIQHYQSGGGELEPYYGMIDESAFGPAEEFRDAGNPKLAPDNVSIKHQGEEPIVLTVVTDPEVRCDGGIVSRPAWTPTAHTHDENRCQNCDSKVTQQFTRVFGDNSDTTWACRECTPYRDLQRGAGADPDYTRGDRQ